jgi:hypothetical protein
VAPVGRARGSGEVNVIPSTLPAGKEYQSARGGFQQKDVKERDELMKSARSRTLDAPRANSDDRSAHHDEPAT